MSDYELLSSILGISGFVLSVLLAIREWAKSRVHFRARDGRWIVFSNHSCVMDFVLVNSTRSALSIAGIDLVVGGAKVAADRYPVRLFTAVTSKNGLPNEDTRVNLISTVFPLSLSPCESARLTVRFDHDQLSNLQKLQTQHRPGRWHKGGTPEAKRLLIHTSRRSVKLLVPFQVVGYLEWCRQAVPVR